MKSLRTKPAAGSVLLCLLTAHGAVGRPPQTTTRVPSPLTVVADRPAGAVTTLTLDRVRYARLRHVQNVVITAFPLDAATRVDLDLYRFEILTDNAQVIVHTAAGVIEVPPPDLVLLRGTVVGRPGSRVFLGLTPRGTNGYIRIDGDRYVIAGARPGDPRPTVITHLEGIPDNAMGIAPFVCGTDALPRLANVIDGAVAGAASGTCGFEIEIAIETDWEFTDAFKGDTEASGAYAMTLMGAMAEIYLTEDAADNDVGIALTVSHLSLWDCAEPTPPCEYPWTANTAHGQLDEFMDYWNANMNDVPRSTAHFLSTRSFVDAGGVAYLGVLCHPDFGYGISGHLNGSFPEPLVIEGDPQNWDVVVVAHELGHNFGAPHTHAVAPPIDLCAFGECIVDPVTMTVEGTIMSYCHLCKGGLVNVNLFYHDRILDERIHPYLATNPCVLSLENIEIVDQPLSQVVCSGDLVILAVTATANVPLTYQWRKNADDIPGATDTIFSIAPFGMEDEGAYDVIVFGECGSILSDVALLQIDDCLCESISIVGQPASQTVCEGDEVIFTVVADGNVPLTYQWRKDTADIPGATGLVYSIAAVNVTDAGTYDVIVTGQCTEVQSNGAVLQVDGGPACKCPADLDDDGNVGINDFLLVLSMWGSDPGGPPDFDGDGDVGINDLLFLLARWGPC